MQFERILRMTQMELKTYLADTLKKTHNTIVCEDGFLYAKGTVPILLVAHLDTVHKSLPSVIYYDKETDALSADEGIGGDDRCGVYMILRILRYYNCSVLFCEDEEIGCIGATKFVESKYCEDVTPQYILEFDRKGSNDAVFYDCANKDFEEFITSVFYKTANGLWSDISVLAPAIGCAAVNLSCGYYNAHTKNEYIVLHEMEASIQAALDIIEDTTDNHVFNYVEKGKGYSLTFWDNNDDFFDYPYDGNYMIEYYDYGATRTEYVTYQADSIAEAVGKFLMDNPNSCYSDVISVELLEEGQK